MLADGIKCTIGTSQNQSLTDLHRWYKMYHPYIYNNIYHSIHSVLCVHPPTHTTKHSVYNSIYYYNNRNYRSYRDVIDASGLRRCLATNFGPSARMIEIIEEQKL